MAIPLFNIIWNGYTVCPEKWGTTDVIEPFHRIYYVYGGEAWFSCGGETVPLRPGFLYVFPVYRRFSTWHNPGNPLRVLWFHVEFPFVLGRKLLWLEIGRETVLSHILDALRLLSNRNVRDRQLQLVFTVFVHLLYEKISRGKRLSDKKMQSVLKYVNENIAKPLTVGALARRFRTDRSSFSRWFKKTFYIPPSQYISDTRMKLAAKCLRDGESVCAAALRCGYSDEKVFSRAFKKHMGVPPSFYRNRTG